jgi:hypothetical protein
VAKTDIHFIRFSLPFGIARTITIATTGRKTIQVKIPMPSICIYLAEFLFLKLYPMKM